MTRTINRLLKKIRWKLAGKNGRTNWTESDHYKAKKHFEKFVQPSDNDFDCFTMRTVNLDNVSALLTADCVPVRMIFDYDPNYQGVIVRKAVLLEKGK